MRFFDHLLVAYFLDHPVEQEKNAIASKPKQLKLSRTSCPLPVASCDTRPKVVVLDAHR